MKILFLLAVALLTGCAQTQLARYDTTPRPPTPGVEIFKDGAAPPRPYKIIAETTWMGPHQDELRAQKSFVNKACKLGGDGLIFSKEGENQAKFGALGSFASGAVETSWLFKSKIIVYDK